MYLGPLRLRWPTALALTMHEASDLPLSECQQLAGYFSLGAMQERRMMTVNRCSGGPTFRSRLCASPPGRGHLIKCQRSSLVVWSMSSTSMVISVDCPVPEGLKAQLCSGLWLNSHPRFPSPRAQRVVAKLPASPTHPVPDTAYAENLAMWTGQS
jgi:hypothetical protein